MESANPAVETDPEKTLWLTWQAEHDPQARLALFEFYAGWSRILAGHYCVRYPHPLAEYTDYLSLSSLGLLQAIDGFEPTRGVRFKTYAEPFIKGAVLKGLSCYIKDRQHTTRERISSVVQEEPGEDDFSAIVNLTVGLALGYFLELGILDVEHDNNPASLYERQSGAETLAYLVEQLTANERQVIIGHYYQQLSFVQISELMGVSKSRVSQLHGLGLKKLRGLYAGLC